MYHWFKRHTKEGLEIPDPTPVALDLEKPISLQERLARAMKDEMLMRNIQNSGMDTFDEADDLDVEDDWDDRIPTRSMYEEDFQEGSKPFPKARIDEMANGMVQDIPQERKEAMEEFKRAKKQKQAEKELDKEEKRSS